ncbi:MAG: outer membrane protein transport protein [Acidobacteria bacterium]|nr:outer membrane protein transport protein [Acidobacteriota bacterium]MDW7985440.1 outer membrane protein transport protein [Acidobacteriota bacterium]
MRLKTYRMMGIVILMGLFAGTARPAGFALFEAGARAMARSGAFVATADDPAAIFFNPAGLAFQTPRWQIYGGATLIVPRAKFEGANPFPGDGVTHDLKTKVFLPPNLYVTYKVHDRITVGMGLFSAFGLGTAWEDPANFTGRYLSFDSGLQTLSLQPTVAVQVSDQLAIGGGPEVRFSKVTLNRYFPFFDPFRFAFVDAARVHLESDWTLSVGFAAGILYKVTDQLRFGIAYRHHMTPDLEGELTLERLPTGNPQLDALLSAALPQQPLKARAAHFAFPRELLLGVGVSPWPTWDFELDVYWTQWSRFETIFLEVPDQPTFNQEVPENYKDTFSVRFGAEKRLTDQWSLMGGFYFDQNPVPIESVDPVLPDADRWGVTLGVTYRRGAWRVEVTEFLLFFRNRTVTPDRCEAEQVVCSRGYFGTYKAFTNLLGINVGYQF